MMSGAGPAPCPPVAGRPGGRGLVGRLLPGGWLRITRSVFVRGRGVFVFDDLFALNGERLDDHVTLVAQPVLARHFWPDGSMLDLTPDRDANAEMAKAGMEGFQEFMVKPDDMDRILERLEKVRARVHK